MVPRVKRKRPYPAPFKQGRLDSLCGLYATINAMRFACHTAGITTNISWNAVFRIMVERIDTKWCLADVLTEGTDSPEIKQCLRAAAVHLKRSHGITLQVTWPWSKRRVLNPITALQQLAHRLERGKALLLGYDGHKESHWTVVTEVTRTHVVLMNSCHGPTMKLSDFAFHPEGDLAMHQAYVLGAWSAALIIVSKK